MFNDRLLLMQGLRKLNLTFKQLFSSVKIKRHKYDIFSNKATTYKYQPLRR